MAELRRAIRRRKQLLCSIPLIFSIILLCIAGTLFYLSWHGRQPEQQRHDAMIAQVERFMAQEREQLSEIANRPVSFSYENAADMEAYSNYFNEYITIRNHYRQVCDSVMATYDETDPLREQFFQLWTHRESTMDVEFIPQISAKRQ